MARCIINSSEIIAIDRDRTVDLCCGATLMVVNESTVNGVVNNQANSPGIINTDGTSYKKPPFCLPGKYGNETSPPIKFSSTSSSQNVATTACKSCDSGKFSKYLPRVTTADDCSPCPTGRTSTGVQCVEIPSCNYDYDCLNQFQLGLASCDTSINKCRLCSAGYYCSYGMQPCPKGRYGNVKGRKTILGACPHVCPYGASTPNEATTSNQCTVTSCTSHFDCSSTSGTGGLVGAGITCNKTTNTCGACPAGSYCPQYWRMKQLCPPGRYGNTTGTSSLQAGCPYECPTGTISTHGSTDSSQCTSKNSTNTKWCTTRAASGNYSILMIVVYRIMPWRGSQTYMEDLLRMSMLRRQF